MPGVVKPPREIKIGDLIEEVKARKATVNRNYQRDKAWDEQTQKELIKSILKGYCIGLLTFKQHEENHNYWDIIDGQQRIDTIFHFIGERVGWAIGSDGEPLTFELDAEEKKEFGIHADKLKFKAFNDSQKRRFLSEGTAAYVELGYDMDDEATAKYFVALQQGEPLNHAELLSAMPGYLRNLIACSADNFPVLSDKKTWGPAIAKPYRFNRRYRLSELLALERAVKWKKNHPDFSSVNYRYDPTLRNLYREFQKPDKKRTKEINKLYEKVERTLETMEVAFEKQGIRSMTYFVPVYLLTSYLEEFNYAYNLDKYGNFISLFVKQIKSADPAKEGKFSRLNELFSGGTTADRIRKRFHALKDEFKKRFPGRLVQRDSPRLFSNGQKSKIYATYKGKCFFRDNLELGCPKTQVKTGDAAYHHIKFWSGGGKTNPKNGALCHPQCHRDFHALEGKKDLDLEEMRRLECLAKVREKRASRRVRDYIGQRESTTLEFKSTLRWDLKNNKRNDDMQKAAIEEIAAFLNTEGGVLIIGIADGGEIVGIEKDFPTLKHQNTDGFEQLLRDLISSYLGDEFHPSIKVSFEKVSKHNVCMILIERGPKPAFVKDQDFFIRAGNTKRLLSPSKVPEYIKSHAAEW